MHCPPNFIYSSTFNLSGLVLSILFSIVSLSVIFHSLILFAMGSDTMVHSMESVEIKQMRRFNTMERRPRTLKDFLSETNLNSCSSSGFKSLPRIKPNMNTLIEKQLERSKQNTPNSTFQTLINSIRSILVKKSATMILPRSISHKLSSSSTPSKSRRMKNQSFCKGGCEIEPSTVKIKDIIRWKSFRDINNVDEQHNQSQPLDFPSQPSPPPLDFHNCMMGSTTTTTCSSSKGSSWSDSDFTLSSWEAQNDVVEARTMTKRVSTFKEDEQHSPVSVLQIGEDEFSSCFDEILFNIERRKQKFIQSVQRLEGFPKFEQCLLLDNNEKNPNNYDDEENEEHEERARELLHSVKETESIQNFKNDYNMDILLLDFFREELNGIREQNDHDYDYDECEREILRIAKDWIKNESQGCDMDHVNKNACIRDMERKGEWERFEKEKQEQVLQIEIDILNDLVSEVLF